MLKIYPAYISKSNSNREKQVILLMILSREKYRTKSKGWWHYLAVKKLSVLLRGIILKKNHKFLDKSIYFWLAFESYCFHGHA